MSNLNSSNLNEKFIKLFNSFQQLDIEDRELNFFDIGTRGHFENPTTEVLSFFLNPSKQHGLDNCFYQGLQHLLADRNIATSLGKLKNIETEVSTQNDKRIDLILETTRTLILIECKINHAQNNPFDDYTAYGLDKLAKSVEKSSTEKNLCKLVLCLDGCLTTALSGSNWHGITYSEITQYINEELAVALLDNPYNKWGLFAREFLLHLEGLTYMAKIMDNEIDFLNENIKAFTQLSQYINGSLIPKVVNAIEYELNNSEFDNFLCGIKYEKWGDHSSDIRVFNAIRFFNSNFEVDSDIVVWIRDHHESISHSINLHISAQSDALVEEFKKIIGKDLYDSNNSIWYESNERYWGITWEYNHLDINILIQQMKVLMSALNILELEVRPKLKM